MARPPHQLICPQILRRFSGFMIIPMELLCGPSDGQLSEIVTETRSIRLTTPCLTTLWVPNLDSGQYQWLRLEDSSWITKPHKRPLPKHRLNLPFSCPLNIIG